MEDESENFGAKLGVFRPKEVFSDLCFVNVGVFNLLLGFSRPEVTLGLLILILLDFFSVIMEANEGFFKFGFGISIF